MPRSLARLLSVSLALALVLTMNSSSNAQELDVPFTKHVLDNGLEVVIHEDHSDPVVAVYIIYHVGSGREEPGRSGFAHLFEHMLFQGSQHVGDDAHFKIVSESGGTLNGTTNRDRTLYFETVPSNQLETALWLEADRMGFLLPAMTQEKLDNQIDVVKNERRQNYENVPYRKSETELIKALYPAGHPYSWTTIGSHEDLSAASLTDVHGFFRRWYGPNNATLAIGGDVDPETTMELVKKYFGSIPRGPKVERPRAWEAELDETVRLVAEDKIKLPQLTMVWPTAVRDTKDEAALGMLASILSANKAAILDKALSIDETLVTRVSAYQSRDELSGEFRITVRAAPGVTLDELELKIEELLHQLARDGVDRDQLRRMQNRYEANEINRLETVSSRTSALCDANAFLGDPGKLGDRLRMALDVNTHRVENVLKKYILDRPRVVLSIVPEGELQMAASGRTPEQHALEMSFDRHEQPAPGPVANFRPPEAWHDTLPNGVEVVGTRYTELPLVSLQLSVSAGHMRENMDELGLASLTASLMNEGTTSLDTVELQNKLDELGASLRVFSSGDEIGISLRTLKRHLPAATALLEDMVLNPRFAQEDFERIKEQRIASLETRGDSIRGIAGNSWNKLMYAQGEVAGMPSAGTLDTVPDLTVEHVRSFFDRHVVPGGARLSVVGDVDPTELRTLFAGLSSNWQGSALEPIPTERRPDIASTQVYLVDKPGAAQSEIRIGHPSIAATHPDDYPLSVMNYSLGGTFSSRINMNLREDKGYTYGARSRFGGGLRTGTFTASAGVKTDVTKESVQEFMKELRAIHEGFTEDEVEYTRDALVQAMNRQYESVGALSGLVDSISRYGRPDDFLVRRLEFLQSVDKSQLDQLAKTYIDPDRMIILVVGDAEIIREGLAELGYGEPIELDIDGNPLSSNS
ncbi:MAG: M16 family metallopeptidase [Planctomycetota bacterium]